jgi:cytochrome P450
MATQTYVREARAPDKFNLLETATFAEGHPWRLYEAMRKTGPVLRHKGTSDIPDFWVLTNHEDVHAVSHDLAQFSSAEGFNIPIGARRTQPEVANAIGRNILTYDMPDHAEFKRILMPAFTAVRLKALEERSRAYVEKLLDGLEGRDEIEFVSEVAALLPIRVLCDLLGIPAEDEAKILDWTNKMVGGADPEVVADPMVSFAAFMEVFAYGKWLVQKRLEEPQGDLMSMVAHATLQGTPFDDATRDGMCATLIAAGNETTRNAITASIVLMTEASEQKRLLSENPEIIGTATEEFLRRSTPIYHMMRTAKEDLEIQGAKIAKGEHVAMLYGAANHDPAVFADPYALDLKRENARKHLAFGTGVHICIGQRVAQMELKILIPELLRRFPRIEATSEPSYLLSNFVCGIKRLPVSLR